jgi:nitroimidazol reductase NimA-like FMN-containing flavoprotein (pyridoxamine 5'-phosphate oxidase superfamily)
MRRADREVTETSKLMKIIDECDVCRIAMQDKAGLYIVPMNFGYTYDNNQLVLFFHSAKEGRKINAIKENSNVCFEMDCGHELIEADTPCGYGYCFKSIVGNGNAVIVEDAEEKKAALSALMRHQTGQEFIFDERMSESVLVFKIVVCNFTGKDHG